MTGLSSPVVTLFQTLVEIVSSLRGPQGCPWDKEQTQTSLTQYAIEEAFELTEAIESRDQAAIREELGDFLFQVVLQAQVAQDEGHFDLAQVIATLNEKMIRRHPHVFGEVQVRDSQEVLRNWDQLKALEKKTGSASQSPLFSYPRNLPALQASAKIGRKTESWKFDWRSTADVLEKVREELEETAAEVSASPPDRDRLEHEIGDLLFSVAQLARHSGLDPEACLRRANRRFESRFRQVVDESGLDKEKFAALPDAEKEALWARAKSREKAVE